MTMLKKVNGLPAQRIEAQIRRDMSLSGLGFGVKVESLARAILKPALMPRQFQTVAKRLTKAKRRKS